MRAKSLVTYASGLAGAGAAFALVAVLVGWLARSNLQGQPPSWSEETRRAAREARDVTVDLANPLVLHEKVDYSEGESGPWYPKGEAPILAELVAQGHIPPVAERVGPEPCVMKGVDGTGNYGGTWLRLGGPGWISYRGSYASLVRWSPSGYPIVPHVAKGYSVSDDNREYTFTLRRELKWSDGHPFTADDILYWWKHECNDKAILGVPPSFMLVRGQPGRVEKLDTYRVRITFPQPNGLFLERLAQRPGLEMTNTPERYLKQYHPTIGDADVIEAHMQARRLRSRKDVYDDVKDVLNPMHPRLWPWLYRTYKAGGQQSAVRNPYYWVVDTEGNQLPYLDRVVFDAKSRDMTVQALANGEVSMQWMYNLFKDYTLLMSQRKKYDYEVYHWYAGECTFVIYPNLNRCIEPGQPDTAKKHALLNDKRFRQALSLAIDRQAIIQAVYNGLGEPSTLMPDPSSFFYNAPAYKKYTEHDPERANRLLDEIGLAKRDLEGFRTFQDGSRMTFVLTFAPTDPATGQFVVEDWWNVGLRVLLRRQGGNLFSTERKACKHDMDTWSGRGNFPMLSPGNIIGMTSPGFGRWYARGGLYGNPKADRAHGCVEPPPGSPMRTALLTYERAAQERERAKQREILNEAIEIAAENVWSINIASAPPALSVVKNGFRNVPRKATHLYPLLSPGNAGIETYFWDRPEDSPGAIAEIKQAIRRARPAPDIPAPQQTSTGSGGFVTSVLKYGFLLIGVALVLMVAVRHPYIGRRLLVMIPALLIISVVSFTIIQLPPGDFVTSKIMELETSGDEVDLQQIEKLKQMFHLEESMPSRYVRWMGLQWFRSFDDKDEGLLQGNMGRSMAYLKPVNDLVGDRILLTFLISLGTILFTWAVAFPIGIYSAVRQYSITDYVFTFIGFIGMCVPAFLLALLLMYASGEWLGTPVSGLFSSRYGTQPEWTWDKVVDLLKHIWVPIVVMGVGGTAGMIRVMRANLLDELKKPYVVTARAKGVRPMKLLFKYPVRLALNPFISGIGGLFPALVSGGAIVGIVLSLPTVGPLMLQALMSEDMYLAGSMLMVLSVLGVFGTLVSDLLLLWLDPRIRYGGGAR